jgi:hypothetical protein
MTRWPVRRPERPGTDTLTAMERLLAANSAEIGRADAKAAILLGFLGAVLAVLVGATRGGPAAHPSGPAGGILWWGAVTVVLLAIACCVSAIVPRRRAGRRDRVAGPGYFEHFAAGDTRAGEALGSGAYDPAASLLAALRGTSAIIRAKYAWIERGAALLLLALPLLVAGVRPV